MDQQFYHRVIDLLWAEGKESEEELKRMAERQDKLRKQELQPQQLSQGSLNKGRTGTNAYKGTALPTKRNHREMTASGNAKDRNAARLQPAKKVTKLIDMPASASSNSRSRPAARPTTKRVK